MNRIVYIVLILFFLFSVRTVLAADSNPASGSGTASSEQTTKEDDYTLPYPGILPDNPFYMLKTARDNFIGLLISDAKKKAEFNLLQADKRLQAGVYLIDKNKKYDLAEQTISKGENYFEQAISKLEEAKKTEG
jgi:hypothetical protein